MSAPKAADIQSDRKINRTVLPYIDHLYIRGSLHQRTAKEGRDCDEDRYCSNVSHDAVNISDAVMTGAGEY